MLSALRDALLSHTSLSIIGMCKNAGKTTVLNRLIAMLAELPKLPALTSIGRDGEASDVVTGTEKPGIWVREGSLVATGADMLRLCDTEREILETTWVFTPLGEVVIFRALSDGFVQLAGPSMNDQISALTARLHALGADIVLIDGAVSRRTLSAPTVSGATILCAGASYHPDMDTVVADTAYVCGLLTLPRSEGDHASRHLMEGAATDTLIARLSPQPGDEITVRDGSRLMLTRGVYERLLRQGVRFTVLERTALCCVCVNPFSATGAHFDARAFARKMADAVPVPVLDVKELSND